MEKMFSQMAFPMLFLNYNLGYCEKLWITEIYFVPKK